jgi:subtilisin family serine protease
VTQAWRQAEGAGVTVAVLGTGIDARYPRLSGAVIPGPDETGAAAGRERGGSFWGLEGTAVAGLIAGRGPGSGLTGIAPEAKILSLRVTLEFNDPLAADPAAGRRLPAAIAAGIRYAAAHGARIIDLPLDPGTLGLTGRGEPAAAGGSAAERAAVSYALSRGIVLVAPAGDDREGPGIVNYPAAYPGVIAVGAVDRAGRLAEFSSTRSGARLTAPGVALASAVPPDGYGTISSTSAASGIVAGVAALVRSRYPKLTMTQVTRALMASTGRVSAEGGGSLPPAPAGTGYGMVNATRALAAAAVISTASQPPAATRAARPAGPAAHRLTATATPHRTAATALAATVLRDAVLAVGLVIAALLAALLALRVARSRRRRAAGRSRATGQHEQHPGADPTAVLADDRP